MIHKQISYNNSYEDMKKYSTYQTKDKKYVCQTGQYFQNNKFLIIQANYKLYYLYDRLLFLHCYRYYSISNSCLEEKKLPMSISKNLLLN